MNEFEYRSNDEDDVLDSVENSIIAVNLPHAATRWQRLSQSAESASAELALTEPRFW